MDTLIELQVISYIIQSKDIEMLTGNGITPHDFTGVYEEQVSYIFDHHKMYGTTPDHITMIRQFPDDYEQMVIEESPLYLEEQLVRHIKYKKSAEVINKNRNLLLSNDPDDVNQALKELSDKLGDIGTSLGTRNLGVDISKDTSRYDLYEKRLAGDYDKMYETGIKALDDILQGILSDDLITIYARSSHGKSFVMNLLAVALYKQGLNVLFYSGEMESTQVAYRFDSIMSGLSNNSLMFGKPLYDRDGKRVEADKYQEYLGDLKERDNYFRVVTPREAFNGKTPTVAAIEELTKSLKPDVVFIDQLSLMGDASKARTTREQYANIVRDLRLFAENHEVPTFLAAQANREATEKADDGSNKIPEPHHLAHSDDILHYSTRIIGIALNRSEGSTTHIMSFGVRKNRHADLADFDMLVDFDKGVFEHYVAPEIEDADDVDNIFAGFVDGSIEDIDFGGDDIWS